MTDKPKNILEALAQVQRNKQNMLNEATPAPSRPVKTVQTKGGNFPVYGKSSPEAQSFRDAFAAARKEQGAGGKFTWQGRSYSTNRADDKPGAAAKPAAPAEKTPQQKAEDETRAARTGASRDLEDRNDGQDFASRRTGDNTMSGEDDKPDSQSDTLSAARERAREYMRTPPSSGNNNQNSQPETNNQRPQPAQPQTRPPSGSNGGEINNIGDDPKIQNVKLNSTERPAKSQTASIQTASYEYPNSPMIEAFLKLQAKNSHNLFAEAKKKTLDPVGKEDDDIDNDGDSDKTDSYLRNRRRAIGKAIKEASDDEVNAIIKGVPGQKNKERESSSKDDINSAKGSKPERKDNDSEKPAKSSSTPSIKPGDQTMVGQDDDDKPEPAKKPVIKPTDQTMVGQDDDKPEPAKKPATPERSQAFRDLTRKHDEDPEFRYTELELDQMRDQIKKLPKDEQTAFIVRQLTPRPSVVKKYGMGRRVDEAREDRRSAHPDHAAPGDPRAPKYKDEIEPKKEFPDHPMPPRRPKDLRNESRITEQGVEVISANDPRTKNYAIPKSDVGTFPASQSDRDNEKKEKYTNRAPSERPYGDLQGAKKAMAKEEVSFSRAELEHFAYILEMSVAPTPDDYSGSNNGPSKRDLSDETIVETKKKDPSQLQKRGRKAGVKVGSYKMKGMDDVEGDEHKAEPKNLVAQNPRTYSKEGKNLVDLEHPSKPGVKRTVPAKEYNSFRSSYLNSEKPEHKSRMHDDYVKRVFN